MLHTLIKRAAPAAAMALGLALSGCGDVNITMGGDEGVPLAELDMTGAAPDTVAMLGPDTVVVTEGDTLDISVEGDDDAVAAVRFTLDGGTLGIMREDDNWSDTDTATIHVTMPAPAELDVAGSGTIEASTMAADAQVNMAGSGTISVAQLTAQQLDISMAGSGTITAAGTVDSLDISILGSGDVRLNDLTAERTEVSIAGSGNVALASDGAVEANIAGSGNVTVIGSATCEVNSMGSGTVTCRAAQDDADAPEAAEVDEVEEAGA